MRIISGKHKGRKLISPENDAIRPTADNVREALFNMLGNINGLRFLDLFGGSGAVALEALSRGAQVEVNDRDKKSVALIKKNFELCKETVFVSNLDAITAVKNKTSPYNVIFMDPPYAYDVTPLLKELRASKCVDENTLIVYEKAYSDELPDSSGYELIDNRKYGYVGLVFYKITEEEK